MGSSDSSVLSALHVYFFWFVRWLWSIRGETLIATILACIAWVELRRTKPRESPLLLSHGKQPAVSTAEVRVCDATPIESL